MIFYKNKISNKLTLCLKICTCLASLFISLKAAAFACPGSGDFEHKKGLLWGWSWGLRPNHDINPNFSFIYDDFLDLRSDFRSPLEQEFLPSYPLTVTLYLKESNLYSNKITLRCHYELPGSGFTLLSSYKQTSLIELDKITHSNSWKKRGVWKRQCSTTAGTPDQCSIEAI